MPKRSNYFRPPEEDGEIVAILEKNMGNGILQVKVPGDILLCHVRKKFGKERAPKVGTWLLVGLRSFETNKKHCVYCRIQVPRTGFWLSI